MNKRADSSIDHGGHQRRSFALSIAALVVMWICMGSRVTLTGMGGMPERDAGGNLVLNDHGTVSPAGGKGWAIARGLHIGLWSRSAS